MTDCFVLLPTASYYPRLRWAKLEAGQGIRTFDDRILVNSDSYYHQPLRSISDLFVLSATDSVYCRLLRTSGDRFVLLQPRLRTSDNCASYIWRPFFVPLPTDTQKYSN